MTLNRAIGSRSPAETLGKGFVKIIDSLVNVAVLIIFLLFLLYGSYALWDTNQIYKAADHRQFAMYKPPTDDAASSLSFDELRNINPDVFSWLTVYGTNIDYPVVHTDNNETYVNTSITGEYSLVGSLFLDKDNQIDYSDHNNLIYGHHMEKNAMFGDLDKFLDETYFSERLYGNLYYSGKNHGLEFFAMLETDAYDYDIYDAAVSQEQAQDYLDGIMSKALYSRDISVTAQDQLVLLSTCVSDSTNGRHILVGRITDNTFTNTFYEETSERRTTPLRTVDSLSSMPFLQRLPPWAWAVLVLLLLSVILYVILQLLGNKARKSAYGKKQ